MFIAPQPRKAAAITKTQPMPFPAKGWHIKGPVTGMGKDEALRIHNAIVYQDGIRPRHGYTTHASGLGAGVYTLMDWAAEGTSPKLFAATPTAIFDVTTFGTSSPSAAVTGQHSGRWSVAPLSNIGTTFIWCCNDHSSDVPMVYDGTGWSAADVQGCEAGKLYPCCSHMGRIFAAEKGALKLWYLATHAADGPAYMIDLAPACQKGGEVVAMASLPRSGGRSKADQLVVVTSKNEVLVWSGTDPDNAATWDEAGVYTIPSVVGGARCFTQFGSSLLVSTCVGVLPLTDVLAAPPASESTGAVSEPIYDAIVSAADQISGETGWQIIEGVDDSVLVLNVPLPGGIRQFARYERSQAWCSWDIPATCWGRVGGALYFGTPDGKVKAYGAGVYTDDGDAIEAEIIHSYQGHGAWKNYTRVRPWLMAPNHYRPRVKVVTDYRPLDDAYPAHNTASLTNAWDGLTWQDWSWESRPSERFSWRGVRGAGVAAALIISCKSTAPWLYRGADLEYFLGGHP